MIENWEYLGKGFYREISTGNIFSAYTGAMSYSASYIGSGSGTVIPTEDTKPIEVKGYREQHLNKIESDLLNIEIPKCKNIHLVG